MARLNYGDSMYVNDSVGNAISYDDIYLGGYSDFSAIAKRVHTEKGFHGCIKEIHINNNQIVFNIQKQHNSIRWDAVNFRRNWERLVKGLKQKVLGKHLDSCNTYCSRTTCLNGGECVEYHEIFKLTPCSCLPGYTGNKCEK
ncbi:heparan sulfate proteoglycan 2, partial [Plakobranchus ocellatus]